MSEKAKRLLEYQRTNLDMGLAKISETTIKEFEKGSDVEIIPVLAIGSNPDPYTVTLSEGDILYVVHITPQGVK